MQRLKESKQKDLQIYNLGYEIDSLESCNINTIFFFKKISETKL